MQTKETKYRSLISPQYYLTTEDIVNMVEEMVEMGGNLGEAARRWKITIDSLENMMENSNRLDLSAKVRIYTSKYNPYFSIRENKII